MKANITAEIDDLLCSLQNEKELWSGYKSSLDRIIKRIILDPNSDEDFNVFDDLRMLYKIYYLIETLSIPSGDYSDKLILRE